MLADIEPDLFAKFSSLKYIDLSLDNWREFFHRGNKWLLPLNDTLVRFRLMKAHVSFDQIYEYPLEDICLFEKFPHQKRVLPIIVPGKDLTCTCTLKWLQINSSLFEAKLKSTNNYSLNYEDQNAIYNYFLVYRTVYYKFCPESFACDFGELFSKCHLEEASYNYIYNHVWESKLLR